MHSILEKGLWTLGTSLALGWGGCAGADKAAYLHRGVVGQFDCGRRGQIIYCDRAGRSLPLLLWPSPEPTPGSPASCSLARSLRGPLRRFPSNPRRGGEGRTQRAASQGLTGREPPRLDRSRTDPDASTTWVLLPPSNHGDWSHRPPGNVMAAAPNCAFQGASRGARWFRETRARFGI